MKCHNVGCLIIEPIHHLRHGRVLEQMEGSGEAGIFKLKRKGFVEKL